MTYTTFTVDLDRGIPARFTEFLLSQPYPVCRIPEAWAQSADDVVRADSLDRCAELVTGLLLDSATTEAHSWIMLTVCEQDDCEQPPRDAGVPGEAVRLCCYYHTEDGDRRVYFSLYVLRDESGFVILV